MLPHDSSHTRLKQEMRPHSGFCLPPKHLLLPEVSTAAARPVPPPCGGPRRGEKKGIAPVGLREQAEALRSHPRLQPSHSHCACPAPAVALRAPPHSFPPRHLFVHRAGSQGKATVPGAGPQLPLHRGPSRATSPQTHSSRAARRNKRDECHLASVPIGGSFHRPHPTPPLSPRSPTPHPHLPRGLFLSVFLNPRESLNTDLNPDTK